MEQVSFQNEYVATKDGIKYGNLSHEAGNDTAEKYCIPKEKMVKCFSVDKYIYEIDIDDSGNKMSMNCGVNQSKTWA